MRKTRPLLSIALVLLFAFAITVRVQALGDDGTLALTLINQARVNSGLVPLALSPQLAAAAQAHADDMARSGVSIGHNGSDGSTPTKRILAAGYHSYSWGPIVGENWAAFRTVDESMKAWMSDLPHRANILRPEYREIGVGVARSSEGVPILVTDFGAQPNVLPVFMNGTGPTIVLTLANENASPQGDGAGVIGRAVSVEISSDGAFLHSVTEPYASAVTFTSADGKPVSSIFVRFRDAAGRTTVSSAGAAAIVVAPVAVPANTRTAQSTRRAVPTPRASPTRARPSPKPISSASATATGALDTETPSDSPLAIADTSSPTPPVTQAALLRRPPATPSFARSVSSVSALQPLADQLALGLFGGAIFLFSFAAATAWRARRR